MPSMRLTRLTSAVSRTWSVARRRVLRLDLCSSRWRAPACSRMYRKAKEQVTHSFVYSYRDRKAKKGDFRRLWIQRINAASRAQGLTYNRLIQGLNLAGVEVDRRMLAELAVNDINAFNALVKVAKDALPADINAPKA